MSHKVPQLKKASGEFEEFSRVKLEQSLKKSGASPDLASEIADYIEGEFEEGMSSSEIYNLAFFILEKNQKIIAARYSLRRAIMDLGPSGFPFEDYLAWLFRENGYTALTRQILLGSCAEQEIDVVAYNKNKLLILEAKFHNQLGKKSDLKIVLYVKARFDDLKENLFNYGGERKIDESWLVTNTKFTSTAIHYGECNNMAIIGWNYPKKGNLQDMIEKSKLYPLTCLTSLSQSQKTKLLSENVVLCRELKSKISTLKSLGLSKEKIQTVLDEAKYL